MAAPYTLKLLGGAFIEGPAGVVSGRSAQRHRLALLALLSAEPNGMSRDKLVGLLWPERELSRARHALSDSIYRINKTLGEGVLVSVGDRDLRLDTHSLPSDLAAFRTAVENVEWTRAVELYGGPFLDGFHLSGSGAFDRWADGERRRLERIHAQALESLADERGESGDVGGSAAAWRQRAALDPYDSRVAVRFMEALWAAGNPAGALRHARVHADLLEDEFGAEPDQAVLALAQRIQDGPDLSPYARRVVGGSSADPEPTAPRPSSGEDLPQAGVEGPREASPPPPAGAGHGRGSRGPGSRTSRGARSRWKTLLMAAGLVVMTVTAIRMQGSAFPLFGRGPSSDPEMLAQRVRGAESEEDPAASIAVLPFEDLSPEGDREWFADGIAEETVQVLARVPGLRVIARESSFAFRSRPADVRKIAEELDVRFIVDGSVRAGGDSVWISAALIDGATAYYLWSETYATSPSADRLRSIQSRIARGVASTLALRVTDEAEFARTDVSDGSYEAYLEGRFHLRRFQSGASSDPREILRSLDYFQSVVEREPDWSEGWASLGEAHHWAAFKGFDPLRNRMRSKDALQRAILLDPDHARANASLGYILHRLDHDYEAATARFRHALELDTDQYWHCGYAFFLFWSERYHDAVEAIRRAEAHDPMFRPLVALRASANRCAGRFEEARRLAEEMSAAHPDWGVVWRDLALSLERTGRADEALARLDDAPRAFRPYLDLVRVLILARSGRAAEADSLLRTIEVDRATEWAAETYSSRQLTAPTIHAAALVALDRREAAIRVLETAMDADSGTMLYDRCYPELRSMEGNPRYRELLRRTGVPSR